MRRVVRVLSHAPLVAALTVSFAAPVHAQQPANEPAAPTLARLAAEWPLTGDDRPLVLQAFRPATRPSSGPLVVQAFAARTADDEVGRSSATEPIADSDEPGRPKSLVPMYVGIVAVQALDFHSTRRAIASGAGEEKNPLLGRLVGNDAAFIAVKASAAAGIIWGTERLWKQNRKAAVICAGAALIVGSAVVARNYRIGR